MYKFLRLVASMLIIFYVQGNAVNVEIIEQYFDYEHIRVVNAFHCFQRKEKIDFFRDISSKYETKAFQMDTNLFLRTNDIFVKRNLKVGMWMDAVNCPYADTLDQLSRLGAFKGTHYFLIFMKEINLLEAVFQNIILTINTQVKVMFADSTVFDIYNPSTIHGGKLIYSYFKNWNITTRQFSRSTKHQHLYWIRRNMTGVLFQTMVVLPQPYFGTLEDYLANDDDREVNTFNRFHAVLMYHIRDYYDYTLNMSVSTSWGYKQSNGTFDGMVRALELRQVDFGSSPLFVKDERLPVVDYGRRTWLLKSSFLFRTPKRPASFEVFSRPLDIYVWYLTAIAIIIIVLLMKLSLSIEINKFKYLVSIFEPSWSHIVLFTLGALCQQGCANSPIGTSSRISFIFIFIFTLLLYQYYSASIVSFLIMAPARFIKTLEDLVFSTLTLGCEDILYNRDYLHKLENDTVVSRLAKKSPHGSEASFYIPPEMGLPRVAAGGYAYHVELATAYPIISRTFSDDAICSLDEIQLFQVQQMHQPVQAGSDFREMLDYVLHRIDESGLMHRQLRHWHAKKPECIRLRPATSSVDIAEFYPALSMLLFGMLFSIFILILEYIVHIQNLKRERKLLAKEPQIDPQNVMVKRNTDNYQIL